MKIQTMLVAAALAGASGTASAQVDLGDTGSGQELLRMAGGSAPQAYVPLPDAGEVRFPFEAPDYAAAKRPARTPSFQRQLELEYDRLDREYEKFRETEQSELVRENVRKYCTVNFKAEEEARLGIARAIGDVSLPITMAVLALSPKDTPVEAHHLYWGWIMARVIPAAASRVPWLDHHAHWLRSGTFENVGRQVEWDDVLNHVLPLGLGIGPNDGSPVHMLHAELSRTLKERLNITVPDIRGR